MTILWDWAADTLLHPPRDLTTRHVTDYPEQARWHIKRPRCTGSRVCSIHDEQKHPHKDTHKKSGIKWVCLSCQRESYWNKKERREEAKARGAYKLKGATA